MTSAVGLGQMTTGPTPDGWEPNWIDHRRSRANVDRREDRGDRVPVCAGCGCELDARPVSHSPRCPTVTGEDSTPDEEEPMRDDAGLAALEAMDNGTPQPHTTAEPVAVKVCKVDGCAEDASDAPKMGRLAGKCEQHREEARVAQSARLTGKARGGKAKAEKASPPRVAPPPTPPTPPTPPPPSPAASTSTNGSLASKAERVLACARAVDELQARLEAARADLKEATEALL